MPADEATGEWVREREEGFEVRRERRGGDWGGGRGARGGKAGPPSARKLRYGHLLNSDLYFSLFFAQFVL